MKTSGSKIPVVFVQGHLTKKNLGLEDASLALLKGSAPELPLLSGKTRPALPLFAYQQMLNVKKLIVEGKGEQANFSPTIIPYLSASSLDFVMDRAHLVKQGVRDQVHQYAVRERAFLDKVSIFTESAGNGDAKIAEELSLFVGYLRPAFPDLTVEHLAKLIANPHRFFDADANLYQAIVSAFSAQSHALGPKKTTAANPPPGPKELNGVERAVLSELAKRQSTEQAVVGVKGAPRSPDTIKLFLETLYEKLEVSSRAEAVSNISNGYPNLSRLLSWDQFNYLRAWVSGNPLIREEPYESVILEVLGVKDRAAAARFCQMLELVPVTFPLLNPKEAGRLKAWAEGTHREQSDDALAISLYEKFRSGGIFTTLQKADGLALTQRPLRDRLTEVPVHAYPSFAPPDRIKYPANVQVIPPTNLLGLLRRISLDTSLQSVAEDRGLHQHPELFNQYLRELYEILGVNSRAGAVERGLEEGLLTPLEAPIDRGIEADWLGRSRH